MMDTGGDLSPLHAKVLSYLGGDLDASLDGGSKDLSLHGIRSDSLDESRSTDHLGPILASGQGAAAACSQPRHPQGQVADGLQGSTAGPKWALEAGSMTLADETLRACLATPVHFGSDGDSDEDFEEASGALELRTIRRPQEELQGGVKARAMEQTLGSTGAFAWTFKGDHDFSRSNGQPVELRTLRAPELAAACAEARSLAASQTSPLAAGDDPQPDEKAAAPLQELRVPGPSELSVSQLLNQSQGEASSPSLAATAAASWRNEWQLGPPEEPAASSCATPPRSAVLEAQGGDLGRVSTEDRAWSDGCPRVPILPERVAPGTLSSEGALRSQAARSSWGFEQVQEPSGPGPAKEAWSAEPDGLGSQGPEQALDAAASSGSGYQEDLVVSQEGSLAASASVSSPKPLVAKSPLKPSPAVPLPKEERAEQPLRRSVEVSSRRPEEVKTSEDDHLTSHRRKGGVEVVVESPRTAKTRLEKFQERTRLGRAQSAPRRQSPAPQSAQADTAALARAQGRAELQPRSAAATPTSQPASGRRPPVSPNTAVAGSMESGGSSSSRPPIPGRPPRGPTPTASSAPAEDFGGEGSEGIATPASGVGLGRAALLSRQSPSGQDMVRRSASAGPASGRRSLAGVQSNRKLVRNALEKYCLKGDANRILREQVLKAFDELQGYERFVILFRSIHTGRHDMRALYGFNEGSWVRLLQALPSPPFLEEKMVAQCLRYDSGGKEFKEVPALQELLNVADAVFLHPQYLQKARVVVQ